MLTGSKRQMGFVKPAAKRSPEHENVGPDCEPRGRAVQAWRRLPQLVAGQRAAAEPARAGLLLAANLLARLYPRIRLRAPRGAPARRPRARSYLINPRATSRSAASLRRRRSSTTAMPMQTSTSLPSPLAPGMFTSTSSRMPTINNLQHRRHSPPPQWASAKSSASLR
jgi:hypothetical protein